MPINAHPEYLAAEKEYLSAYKLEDKLKALEKMISLAPKHKGSENLLKQLKTRYKKLKGQISKNKKSRKGKKPGIKKEDMQTVIIGRTNTGKSSLINLLTNTETEIANYDFTTKKPVVGMMFFKGVQVQLIENPAFESEYYDKGLTNSTDTLSILITELSQIKEIEQEIKKIKAKKIIVFNITNQNKEELRKISATLQSKKYNFMLISTKNPKPEDIEKLKEKIFQSFDKIRVYTKESGKTPNTKIQKIQKPIILEPNSTIKDVAEKILHGFSSKTKYAIITGPSSKFPNQTVGLGHKVKDLDIVEFKTK